MAEAAVMAGVGVAGSAFANAGGLAAASYNKIVSQANAEMAEQQAQMIKDRGVEDANKHRKEVRKLAGTQRARLAAQGVDVTQGSAIDIQLETEILGAEDAMMIENNAFLESMGMRSQAQNMRAQGRLAEMSAENQARNSLITGGLNGFIAGGGLKWSPSATPTKTGSTATQAGHSYRDFSTTV